MDFIIGALSSCGAVLFSNPFDVIKTRMQLQGELKSKGHYMIIYKNIFQATYVIAKNDGLLALQKGLLPAMYYQIVMNGTRFGLYKKIIDSGIISKKNGTTSTFGCITAGAVVGVIGGFLGSPFYLVKTHLQSQAHNSVAVGHQHKHEGSFSALVNIAKKEGTTGLWRGASTSIPRVGIGSASQFFSYSKSKDWLEYFQIFKRDSWQSTFIGAMASGFVIVNCMCPFDVIATRLYNQGTDKYGKGLLYRGIIDCIIKITKSEGLRGFYKGWTAIYLRIGPHSFLNLMFWDYLNYLYKKGKIYVLI